MSFSFSRFNWPASILAATATLAALVIIQPAAFAAKSNKEIREIAYPVTVQINAVPLVENEDFYGGSGVIVGKEGNTYTVITCIHVLESQTFEDTDQGNPTIRTYDQQTYPLTIVKKLGTRKSSDLAVVTFTSSKEYPVAKASYVDTAKPGTPIFVSGYPAQAGKINEARPHELNPGVVNERPSKGYPAGYEPYTMRYSVRTDGGMSGGPVFDADGKLVGIHGEGDQDRTVGAETTIRTGVNAAVPISTFKQLKAQYGVNVPGMVVNNSPSTVNTDERLKNPQSAEEYYAKGVVQNQSGNKQQAIEAYTEAIKRDPNLADAYFQRGNARLNKEDRQGALEDYDRAISLDPNYTDAYFNRAYIRYYQKDDRGALADFSQFISRSPNSVVGYSNRGKVRLAMNDLKGTLEDFDQVVRLAPDKGAAYYNRGEIRRLLKDKAGAIADFEKAAPLYQKEGSTGQYQKALEAIRKLQSMPDAPPTIPQQNPAGNSGQSTPTESVFPPQGQPIPDDPIFQQQGQPTPDDPTVPQENPAGNMGW